MKSFRVEAHSETSKEVASLAQKLSLPFHSHSWRGSSGAWQGYNHGSSIDFQDHRAYVPGDDPRRLDWSAYARTDQYTMKLFREEVSPRLDVALDVSRSMALTPAKETRSLALLALVLQMALRDGINVCVYALQSAGRWRRLETTAARALDTLPAFEFKAEKALALPLKEIPWRSGSLRVLVSDLLVLQAPDITLSHLLRERGRGIILSPYLPEEAEPDWQGNVELRDCETRRSRQQRVEPWLLARYRDSYRRHFEMWREATRKRGVPFARISCQISLGAAVREQALPEGAFFLRR